MAGVCTGPGPCDTTQIGPGPNWVTRAHGLPLYIRAIARAQLRAGVSESDAIALAVGIVRRWARGAGDVTEPTRARARAALAEWDAKKAHARTHDHTQEARVGIDLADPMLARMAPDRAALIALAKKVESWPAGPRKTAMKARIAARARVLHVKPDGDNDFDGDVPSKVPGGMGYRKGADLATPNTAARRALVTRGEALPGGQGGRFPIPDEAYLRKAIRAVGRAKGDHAKVRRFIAARARALGKESLIPSGWRPDGSLTLRARMTGRGR